MRRYFTVNITIAQFCPVLGNKKENIRKINDCIKQAASEQADLVVFPELCLTGYFIWDDIKELAESVSGESLQLLQQSCRDHSIHAVISFPEVTINGHYYITSALIDDTGAVIGTYQKTHLFDREAEIFRPGNTLPVFKTKFGNIGLMICYDLEFPEVARTLKIKGADLLIIPLANMSPYEDYQITYLKSRAMENELPIALCNRIGSEEDTFFFGHSAVVNSKGKVLLKMGSKEQISTVAISLEESKDQKLNYLMHRRADLYK